tara:strand:+ start:247 stop:474 length:228 start_codon:yes stop_codon:yes gene_type:complete
MSNPNFNPATFRYTPQIVSRTDAYGTRRQVTIRFSNSQGQYVASVSHQDMYASGTASSDYAAADAAIANFNRQYL